MRYLIAFLLLAGPLVAQDNPARFSLPAGCTAYLTTQNASCEVEHLFTCDADPAGHQQRVTLDEQGMVFLGVIDAEAQWIDSFHAIDGFNEWLLPDPANPASISELLANGVDHYDFHTQTDKYGAFNFVGSDRLTGREVTIDGVTLLETAFEITAMASNGTVIWTNAGNEYVSPEWRRFFGGIGAITSEYGEDPYDHRPVEFIFPGEPGFLSTRPKHGCGVAISSAPLSEETTYDYL
ncbi:hypothetical protein SAMN04488005_2546 [Yoonia tamlensis]|uniref:Uncharacterized protein n=1 Tax=Yoonia tamlensis TaxID=390270 RepID=A0A1I6HD52_9RHOB|nr:hypothetical protein [Yoonia tamlensis]SFR52435.1 hypothetical protein SAMN04488005_2546 [Yoonia tamlensis]